jgi:hypothetical protein
MLRDLTSRTRLVFPLLLGAISVSLLTAGFLKNAWRVADSNWFTNFQSDSESAIAGRLVQSRQSGILSYGGLTGRGGSPGKGGNDYQFIAYARDLTFTNYTPYMSQIGGQGMLFSALDAALPITPSLKMRTFRLLTSLLTALALTSFVLWFYHEFGKLVAVSVLASTVFAQWLVVIGRTLWWSIWAFFIPVIVIGCYSMRSRWPRGRQYMTLGALAFASVLAKCFINGYEYITPTLVMMLLPLVYYVVADKLGLGALIKGTTVVLLGASVAIIISLIILAYQIASLGGGISAGVEEIRTSLLKRTYGNPTELDPMFTFSLEASPAYVFGQYMTGVFFDPGQFASSALHIGPPTNLPIRYYQFIVALLLATLAILWRSRQGKPGRITQGRIALVATAWCSLAAPLSWFLIFKSHAAAHYHIDFIVWQMPFTLFVLAALGLLAHDLADSLIARQRRFQASGRPEIEHNPQI